LHRTGEVDSAKKGFSQETERKQIAKEKEAATAKA